MICKKSNFTQGIIRFTPDINWDLVYYGAKEIKVNSAFPKKTKILNMLMHLATYLNNTTTCNNDGSWTICKGRDGNYIPIRCTGALIGFKTKSLVEIAINVVGKQVLDILCNE